MPWHFPLHENPNIKGVSLEAEKAFEKQYPAIYEHLLQYKTQLSARNKAETGVRYEWYALQRWGADYKDIFASGTEKLIYPNITQTPCFSYSKENIFCNDKLFILSSNNKSQVKVLSGILNSCVGHFELRQLCSHLGVKGLEIRKIFIENFPIPIIPEVEQKVFIDLVDKILLLKKENKNTQALENEIDNLVYKLYDLTQEEIIFIKKSTKEL